MNPKGRKRAADGTATGGITGRLDRWAEGAEWLQHAGANGDTGRVCCAGYTDGKIRVWAVGRA